MSTYNLDRVLEPHSVAVVGASNRIGSVGYTVLANIKKAGYQGRLFPVNPGQTEILGLPCYPSLKEIGHLLDIVVITTPIAKTPDIIADCAQLDVGGAVIISAGGKESGQGGRDTEQAILQAAANSGLRIIGPNCVGIVNTRRFLNASFSSRLPKAGSLALVSQSGAMCAAIVDWALAENIGFSHFVSIGSMIDVDFGDLIDYLGNDPTVGCILLYVEDIVDTRKFMSAARAVSRIKPILVLKAGRSPAGAKAAASHTGALTGEDSVYDAAFKRAGIVRVYSIEELFDCAGLLARQPRPRGPKIAIVTNAGGPGVMAADEVAVSGLELTKLAPETMEKIEQALPDHWSRNNPIDMLGDAAGEKYLEVIDICSQDPEINGLIIINCPQAMTNSTELAALLSDRLHGLPFPVFTVWLGGQDMLAGRLILNEAEIPVYTSPERAVRAFRYLYLYDRYQTMLREIPRKFPRALQYNTAGAAEILKAADQKGQRILTEIESKELLEQYGIPVSRPRPASTAVEAVKKAREIGFPVVLKLLSPDITHKSDAGGVRLGLRDEKEVREAFHEIITSAQNYNPQAEITGVTVQPMIAHDGYELIIGSKRDSQCGPVILFGMGGILAEILQDRSLGLPPINRPLARRMMEETKVYRLLEGYRGRAGVDPGLLEEVLVRISQLVMDFPQIAELDLNPIVVHNRNIFCLDARLVIEKVAGNNGHSHLIISPYPEQYEMTATTSGGVKIRTRPIRPEDASLLKDLYETLSQKSIYYRFCHTMRELPPEMLARFTQIDYDREMALVALEDNSDQETILGVARAINMRDERSAEIAVVVSDAWHGKGIGAFLLERCMEITIERGIKRLCAYILPENKVMRSLVTKLGWTCASVNEPYYYYPDQPRTEKVCRNEPASGGHEAPLRGWDVL